MIKINLLPYRNERRKELILQQTVLAVAPLVVLLLIFFGLWFINNAKINSADEDVVQIKKQIDECTLQMKEIDEYKKKKEVLVKKLEVITNLQKGKNGPVHILDEMATAIPGNIWLTQVRQKGMSLEITGKAIDNIAISNYMINLSKSPYISDVDLKTITTELAGAKKGSTGMILRSFTISCNITYSPKKAG